MAMNGPFPGKCVGKPDCTRPINVKKRQMCHSCFVSWRRGLEERVCSLEWCDNKWYSRDLCQHHYQRQRQGLENKDPRTPKPTCYGPECDREAGASGLCTTHYKQQWEGKELKPIRKWQTFEDDAHPGLRRCKTCQQWKDRETEFYKTSSGGRQGECANCMIKRSGAWNKGKKLRDQGVNIDEIH